MEIDVIPASGTLVKQIQFLPEFLQFVAADGTPAQMDVSIQMSGVPVVDVSGASVRNLLVAIQQLGRASNLESQGVIGSLQLANGGMGNKTVSLKFTNPVASEVTLKGYSTSQNDGTVNQISTGSIDSNSNETISSFDLLAFQPSNFSRATVTFANGWSDDFSYSELIDLLSMMTPGLVAFDGLGTGTVVVIDNRTGIFRSIKLYAAGASLPYLRTGTIVTP